MYKTVERQQGCLILLILFLPALFVGALIGGIVHSILPSLGAWPGVISVVLIFGALQTGYARLTARQVPICRHCGVETDLGFRVCRSCGRVK